MQKMILVRGLPGSGKSTLARELWSQSTSTDWHETDAWFNLYNDQKFDASKLKTAHDWCQQETIRSAKEGFSVVVSNTFTQEWEMQPYFDIAKKYNMQVVTLVVENRHGNASVHSVPASTIEKMKNRFQIKL